MIKQGFQLSKIGYTAVGCVNCIITLFVLYTFYQRRLNTKQSYWNASVIESIRIDRYQQGLAIAGVALLLSMVILWGLIKRKRFANYLLIGMVAAQTAVFIYVRDVLKSVEGVYYPKSPYVEKFMYAAWTTGLVTALLVLLSSATLFLHLRRRQRQRSASA